MALFLNPELDRLKEIVRILITDPQPIFREGLRRLLETDRSLSVVGQTSDHGSGTIALVHQRTPDLLLLGMAGGSSLALDSLEKLADTGNPVRTIVIAPSVEAPEVVRALHLGVRGVIPKDSTPEVLFASVHSVMAGHFWIGGRCVAKAVDSLRRLGAERRRSKVFGLTRREIDIVRAVVVGYTNKEIARRSSISENTVKCHLSHIFTKLGASNRVELALFASHHRLLDGV